MLLMQITSRFRSSCYVGFITLTGAGQHHGRRIQVVDERLGRYGALGRFAPDGFVAMLAVAGRWRLGALVVPRFRLAGGRLFVVMARTTGRRLVRHLTARPAGLKDLLRDRLKIGHRRGSGMLIGKSFDVFNIADNRIGFLYRCYIMYRSLNRFPIE